MCVSLAQTRGEAKLGDSLAACVRLNTRQNISAFTDALLSPPSLPPSLPRPAPLHKQACCATSGDGLYEGLDWLSAALQKRK